MRLFLTMLIWTFCSITAFAQIPFYGDLDMTRVTTNYNGSAYNGSSILVYGEGGIIIRSTNGGMNWERIALNDSMNILCIVNIGSKYIGLCKNRYGIISEDNGATWTTIDLGVNETFSQMIEKDGSLYSLIKGKVIVYDEHFSKLKEFNFINNYYAASFAIVGNKLLSNAEEGKIVIIDLDSGEKTYLSLKSFGVCTNCDPISALTAFGDEKAYFILNDNLYKIDVGASTITKAGSQSGLSKAVLATYDGDLYALRSAPQSNHLDFLYFERFDKAGENYKKLNTGTDKGYINNLAFTDLQYISKDTIIGVGKNNLIYISYNAGSNWNLISHSGFSFLDMYAFDSSNLRAVSNYGLFYHSDNGGITWLPQENYIQKIATNLTFEMPITWYGGYSFLDKDNGFIHTRPAYVGEENIIYTNDGGKTTSSKSQYNLYRDNFFPTHLKYKENNLWISSGVYTYGWWTMIFKMDDSINIENQTNLQRRIIYSAFVDQDNIYAFGKDSVDEDGVFSVYSSTDGGESWNKEFSALTRKNNKHYRPSVTTIINNSFYVEWNTLLYKFDVQKKTGKLILFKDTSRTTRPIYVKGKYYITFYQFTKPLTLGLVSIADPDADSVIWEQVYLKRFSPPAVFNSYEDSLYAFSTYDTLMGSHAVYLAKPKGTIGITEPISSILRDEISISGPIVGSPEGEYDFMLQLRSTGAFDGARFTAFDVKGSRVNSDYAITARADGKADLKWTPGKLPPGAYIILVKIGNSIGSKTVIVE